MPVTIEVIKRKVDNCFNAFNYIRVTKSVISRSLTVDNEGFGKLSLTLSPHASEINIKVSYYVKKFTINQYLLNI